jgi:hypothetical protein
MRHGMATLDGLTSDIRIVPIIEHRQKTGTRRRQRFRAWTDVKRLTCGISGALLRTIQQLCDHFLIVHIGK